MTADVYVLASPAPVVFIFPSQLHPAPPTGTGHVPVAGRFYPPTFHRPHLDDDETALAVLGAI